MTPTELSVPGYVLRPWLQADAPALTEVANQVDVWKRMSDAFPHPYTLAIAEHWVGAGQHEFGGENFAIAHEGVAVGGAGVHPGTRFLRCNSEIGYFLAPALWGRGVGTAVVAALTALAFARPEVTRVFAPVHAGNAASMRVLAKNGFVLEGTQRHSAYKAGRVIDRVVWARYREPAV
jgi:ribosomal-protein-alanine N-acetyltransferase